MNTLDAIRARHAALMPRLHAIAEKLADGGRGIAVTPEEWCVSSDDAAEAHADRAALLDMLDRLAAVTAEEVAAITADEWARLYVVTGGRLKEAWPHLAAAMLALVRVRVVGAPVRAQAPQEGPPVGQGKG